MKIQFLNLHIYPGTYYGRWRFDRLDWRGGLLGGKWSKRFNSRGNYLEFLFLKLHSKISCPYGFHRIDKHKWCMACGTTIETY